MMAALEIMFWVVNVVMVAGAIWSIWTALGP